MRRLVAALACRNEGSRLYGKPLQNLDITAGLTVLQHIIDQLKDTDAVDDTVLGIAEGDANLCFIDVAKRNGIRYIIGSQVDVLGRLIQCCEHSHGTDVLRLTTESPFACIELISNAWNAHLVDDVDFSCLDNVPAGTGFEIIRLNALRAAHLRGEDRHRSELCSLYIRENKDQFNIRYIPALKEISGRTDLRLAIDYPEDLVVCRAIYSEFKHLAPHIPVSRIVEYLDQQKQLKALVAPLVGPTLALLNK